MKLDAVGATGDLDKTVSVIHVLLGKLEGKTLGNARAAAGQSDTDFNNAAIASAWAAAGRDPIVGGGDRPRERERDDYVPPVWTVGKHDLCDLCTRPDRKHLRKYCPDSATPSVDPRRQAAKASETRNGLTRKKKRVRLAWQAPAPVATIPLVGLRIQTPSRTMARTAVSSRRTTTRTPCQCKRPTWLSPASSRRLIVGTVAPHGSHTALPANPTPLSKRTLRWSRPTPSIAPPLTTRCLAVCDRFPCQRQRFSLLRPCACKHHRPYPCRRPCRLNRRPSPP
jgi:hypothetical protein